MRTPEDVAEISAAANAPPVSFTSAPHRRPKT
jgi:hypothetical protein